MFECVFFSHKMHTTDVLPCLDLVAGPPFTFLKGKLSHNQDSNFPGEENTPRPVQNSNFDAMTV